MTVKEERWEQTGWSDCEIDGGQLAENLQSAISNLNEDGYEVISVSPIESGKYDYKYDYKTHSMGASGGAGYGYGYGYGFSHTEDLTIIARKSS